MKLTYHSYLQFSIKSDVLSRALNLTQEDAAELLAKISGYECHSHMPIGVVCTPPPTRAVIVSRMLALRPDLLLTQACEIVDQLDLPLTPPLGT